MLPAKTTPMAQSTRATVVGMLFHWLAGTSARSCLTWVCVASSLVLSEPVTGPVKPKRTGIAFRVHDFSEHLEHAEGSSKVIEEHLCQICAVDLGWPVVLRHGQFERNERQCEHTQWPLRRAIQPWRGVCRGLFRAPRASCQLVSDPRSVCRVRAGPVPFENTHLSAGRLVWWCRNQEHEPEKNQPSRNCRIEVLHDLVSEIKPRVGIDNEGFHTLCATHSCACSGVFIVVYTRPAGMKKTARISAECGRIGHGRKGWY